MDYIDLITVRIWRKNYSLIFWVVTQATERRIGRQLSPKGTIEQWQSGRCRRRGNFRCSSFSPDQTQACYESQSTAGDHGPSKRVQRTNQAFIRSHAASSRFRGRSFPGMEKSLNAATFSYPYATNIEGVPTGLAACSPFG